MRWNSKLRFLRKYTDNISKLHNQNLEIARVKANREIEYGIEGSYIFYNKCTSGKEKSQWVDRGIGG